MDNNKILVALSGGVDSSACAAMLRDAGYQVAGVVLRMSDVHDGAVADAQTSADQLGIPLIVWHMEEDFDREVAGYFARSYAEGRTPNPCVVCNPLVKFKGLMQAADANGFPTVATGHYAGLRKDGERVLLTMGESRARDQSYMLCRLTQKELSRLCFPLSHLPKDEVRRIAEKAGLSCHDKPDSQEICFIPDGNYAGYIERRLGRSFPEGEYIAPDGTVCGHHRGIIHYTVGQRKKLGIALGRPVFIRRIDPAENRIYLAWGGDEYESEITVSALSETFPGAFDQARTGEMRCSVKVRSRAAAAPCTVRMIGEDRVSVVFDTPERAPAAGQTAAFYDGDVVLGGGFID